MISALLELIIPDGIGRFLVLSIIASYSLSWYSLSAEEPLARIKTPIAAANISKVILPEYMIYPTEVDTATKKVIFTLQSSTSNFIFFFSNCSLYFATSAGFDVSSFLFSQILNSSSGNTITFVYIIE